MQLTPFNVLSSDENREETWESPGANFNKISLTMWEKNTYNNRFFYKTLVGQDDEGSPYKIGNCSQLDPLTWTVSTFWQNKGEKRSYFELIFEWSRYPRNNHFFFSFEQKMTFSHLKNPINACFFTKVWNGNVLHINIGHDFPQLKDKNDERMREEKSCFSSHYSRVVISWISGTWTEFHKEAVARASSTSLIFTIPFSSLPRSGNPERTLEGRVSGTFKEFSGFSENESQIPRRWPRACTL